MTDLPGEPARPSRGTGADPAVPPPTGSFHSRPVPDEAAAGRGPALFAGLLLGLIGVWHAIIGLVALAEPDVLRASTATQPLLAGYEAWAAVHILVGLLALLLGVGVAGGNRVASVGAVVLAVVSAVVTLVFIRSSPFWGCLVIAADVVVIWGVTTQAPPPRPAR